MLLGFLVCRASATMSRKKAAVSVSAVFSSRATTIPPFLQGSSLLQRELSGGLGILILARHLVSSTATERVHSPTEPHHGGFQSDQARGPPHARKPDGFHGAGPGLPLQNVDGFRSGKPAESYWVNPGVSFRGSRDVVPGNPDAYHRGSGPSYQSSDGREGASEQNPCGFRRGTHRDSSADTSLDASSCRGQWAPDGLQGGTTLGHSSWDPWSPQQNPWGYDRGHLGESYPGNPNASSLGKRDGTEWNPDCHGGAQLDEGICGFPGSPSEEIQDRPGDESGEVVGTNCFKGTVDELDDFLKEGKVKEAVHVLLVLDKQGVVVDLPKYLKLLDVCGDAKALEEARFVHDHILRTMGKLEVKVHNRILDMYCKCGSVDDAYQWFDKMPERNFTSWDIMIMGLADNELGEDALDFFNRFLKMGLRPDGHMFIAVFHVCSVLGAVDEGMLHFESMSKLYNIIPTMEHYVSIVDMFGQAGYLDEAAEFIEMMPSEPSVDVWETLMNRCRLQGNVELGDRCAEIVGILDPSRLSDQSKAGLLPVKGSDLVKEKEKKKANVLEVRSRVHEYRAGDTSHPEKDRIYGLIRGLAATLRESGYVPDTRFVLHDIDQESKEEALLAHSERLATAYGLISSAVRSPIRIIKNLRICGDCHSYMKIVSKLVGRELIIRDAKRFHHFKDGVCSCRDYW